MSDMECLVLTLTWLAGRGFGEKEHGAIAKATRETVQEGWCVINHGEHGEGIYYASPYGWGARLMTATKFWLKRVFLCSKIVVCWQEFMSGSDMCEDVYRDISCAQICVFNIAGGKASLGRG
jgi:hypothetical protein